MKTYDSKFRVRAKAVPKHYEPVGPFKLDSYRYETIEDALTDYIRTRLPPISNGQQHYLMDSMGAIVIGYKYVDREERYVWYGLPMAFEIVQNHPSIDSFAAIGWEQEAIHTFHEMR
jgi:hypothetical protein